MSSGPNHLTGARRPAPWQPFCRALALLELRFATFATTTAAALVGAVSVFPAGFLLARAAKVTDHVDVAAVARRAFAAVAVQLVGLGLALLARLRAMRVLKDATARLRLRLLDAQLSAPLGATRGANAADPQFTIVTDTERVDLLVEQILGSAIPGTLLLGAAIGFVAVQDVLLALGVLVIGAPILAIAVAGSQAARGPTIALTEANRDLNARVLRMLRMHDVLVDHGAEGLALAREARELERFSGLSRRNSTANALFVQGQVVAFSVAAAAVLLFASVAVAQGRIDASALFSVLYALVVAQAAARMIVSAQPAYVLGSHALERLDALLSVPGRRQGRAQERVTSLSLEAVSFAHPGGPLLFENLTVTVARGECVVISGPNGSGKSTLLLLLSGRLAPRTGRLNIDGVEFSELDPSSVRRRLAVVGQHTVLAAGTVGDNLRLLGASGTDTRLVELLSLVGLDLSVDQAIGENGELLSGGQRQRLSLARALLGDPDIVLLDEPANHLDERTGALLERLRRARPDLGIVVVTHDVSIPSDVVTRTLRLGCAVA